jgi:hypothetical protein
MDVSTTVAGSNNTQRGDDIPTYEVEHARWQEWIVAMAACHIVRKHGEEDALKDYALRRRPGLFLFLRPVQRHTGVGYVKDFGAGALKQVFQFCNRVKTPVMEEVVVLIVTTYQRPSLIVKYVLEPHSGKLGYTAAKGVMEKVMV